MKISLIPNDSHKSFYGKCYVEIINGTYYLTSYKTIVASYNSRKGFRKHWNGYSATTMRHISAFVEYLGIAGGGKAWWTKLKVEPEHSLTDRIIEYKRKYGETA